MHRGRTAGRKPQRSDRMHRGSLGRGWRRFRSLRPVLPLRRPLPRTDHQLPILPLHLHQPHQGRLMRLLLGGKLAPQTRRGQPQRNHFLLYAVARLRLAADGDRMIGCATRHLSENFTLCGCIFRTLPKTADNSMARLVARFLLQSARWSGRRPQGSCRRVFRRWFYSWASGLSLAAVRSAPTLQGTQACVDH
jgi:hypothetical protein